MNPTFELSADDHTVRVRGELDIATAPALANLLSKLIDGGSADLTIDLSDCEFIDSAGLSAIVSASRRLGENGNGGGPWLTVISANDQTRRLLELVDLPPSLRISTAG